MGGWRCAVVLLSPSVPPDVYGDNSKPRGPVLRGVLVFWNLKTGSIIKRPYAAVRKARCALAAGVKPALRIGWCMQLTAGFWRLAFGRLAFGHPVNHWLTCCSNRASTVWAWRLHSLAPTVCLPDGFPDSSWQGSPKHQGRHPSSEWLRLPNVLASFHPGCRGLTLAAAGRRQRRVGFNRALSTGTRSRPWHRRKTCGCCP